MHHLTPSALSTRLTARFSARLMTRLENLTDDRGDVPGWVLIAVMTAGLVTAIWLIADDQLTGILDRAIGSVASP